jgi:hypothetical protein
MEGTLGGLGCGFSLLAGLLALITALPLLGWGNWLFTLPAALLAIILSVVGLSRGEQTTLAVGGLAIGLGIFFWALFRLALGGGII